MWGASPGNRHARGITGGSKDCACGPSTGVTWPAAKRICTKRRPAYGTVCPAASACPPCADLWSAPAPLPPPNSRCRSTLHTMQPDSMRGFYGEWDDRESSQHKVVQSRVKHCWRLDPFGVPWPTEPEHSPAYAQCHVAHTQTERSRCQRDKWPSMWSSVPEMTSLASPLALQPGREQQFRGEDQFPPHFNRRNATSRRLTDRRGVVTSGR